MENSTGISAEIKNGWIWLNGNYRCSEYENLKNKDTKNAPYALGSYESVGPYMRVFPPKASSHPHHKCIRVKHKIQCSSKNAVIRYDEFIALIKKTTVLSYKQRLFLLSRWKTT